ncbi:hypothetical protein [Heyndrickxia ginsengihumi]|uniref:hypothetical protein n=1 Tax=Heyndrickxia ginsengihumi TaxID=363870 RepID=UPI00046F800F|nr:hypothetical protein [Heyndrickxia ginsengihumi]MBE6185519.1 hypothetical protein [Bacillus sp. (in: firmicutes)]
MRGFFKKRYFLSSGLVLLLTLPTIASAASYSYSFNITSSVTGNTKHTLSAGTVKTTAKGNTYSADGGESSSKSKYQVGVQRFLTNYADPISANGSSYTKTIGSVNSGSYAVVVNKYSSTGYKVKGKGTINQ